MATYAILALAGDLVQASEFSLPAATAMCAPWNECIHEFKGSAIQQNQLVTTPLLHAIQFVSELVDLIFIKLVWISAIHGGQLTAWTQAFVASLRALLNPPPSDMLQVEQIVKSKNVHGRSRATWNNTVKPPIEDTLKEDKPIYWKRTTSLQRTKWLVPC